MEITMFNRDSGDTHDHLAHIERTLGHVLQRVEAVLNQGAVTMSTITDFATAVSADLDAIQAKIAALQAQVAAGTVSAADQLALDQLKAKADALAAPAP